MSAKQCPRCGRPYPENRMFCEDDGARLESAAAVSDSTANLQVNAPASSPARKRLPVSRETLAGTAVVLLLVAIVAGVFTFRQSRIFRLRITFSEAHGIKVGDSVYIRGADVGEVVAAEFEDGHFVATIQVNPAAARQFLKGSEFFVAYDKIFLNKRCIAVLITNPDNEPLTSGSTVPGQDSLVRFYLILLKRYGPVEAARMKDELKDMMGNVSLPETLGDLLKK